GPRAEAEHDIGRRGERRRRRRLEALSETAGADVDFRTHACAVAHPARQPDAYRLVAVAALVAPHDQAAAAGGFDHIALAVALDIRGGERAGRDQPDWRCTRTRLLKGPG